ncbi:MAG: prenyltransferase [Aquiluna sp.]|nr:prenyltransferase [Aquiluna sp.]MCF8546150.1 prenyltransferase [Aquiluna sp.]
MTLVKKLFWSSRPISWINTAFPFAAAYFLGSGEVDWILILGSFFFLIPYNLLMYGVNDVFDYESDLRNPRKGGIEGALLDPRFHKPTLAWSFGLSMPLALSLSFVNQVATGLLWLTIFAVVAYSLKGLRFKEIPFLDSITSAMHFVGPMLVGLAMADVAIDQPIIMLAVLTFFLWGIASHAFGAVQDVKSDREAGIKSIATVIGARKTVAFAFLGYFLAGMLASYFPDRYAFIALAALPYLVVVARELSISDEDCERANRGWKKFIWLNFFAGALVSAILIGPIS